MVIYCMCIADLTRARGIAEQSLQLARTLSDKQVEAFSLIAVGVVISLQGNLKEGIPFVEQSRTLYQALGDKLGQATAMAWLVLNHNDLVQTNIIVLESLRLFREIGHLAGMAVCLSQLAHRRIWAGDFSTAAEWLGEASSIYHQLGDQAGQADTLNIQGSLAYWQGDYQQARAYYEEAVMVAEKVGSYGASTWSHTNLAYTNLRQGNIRQAREKFNVSIQRFQKANSLIVLVYAIEGFASLNVNQDQPERAARLFAWADAMRDQIGDHRPPIEQASVERDLAVIHSKLNDADFVRLSAEGSTMTIEQAIPFALEE
jgi:tetratricopeptide (TPR) repeat protein